MIPISNSDRFDERRFVMALVVVSAILRFFHLGLQSLWVDEIMTLEVATPKPGIPVWKLLLHNIHGPLPTAVVAVFRSFGEADAWIRLPMAVAGTATVVVFYYWVRRWLGTKLARIAAALLAIHPLHILYSQELRNYAFVLFFGVLSCLLFERMQRDDSKYGWIGYALAVAAAALSNFSAAFLFGAHTLIYFLRNGLRALPIRRWLAIAVVILVVISPWIYRIYTFIDVSALVTPVMPGEIDTSERLRGETTFDLAAVPFTGWAFSVGFSLGPSLLELHEDASLGSVVKHHAAVIAWCALLFGVLLVAGLRNLVGRERRWYEALIYILVPLVCVFALNWQNAKAFNVRYVMLALPAYLCVIAAGMEVFRGRWHWLAWGAVGLTLAASLWNYYFDARFHKENVKAAVRYIEQHQETTDCIYAPSVFWVVEHYYHGDAPVHQTFNRAWLSRDRVDAQLEPVFAECNELWYLQARPWVDDADGYLAAAFRQRYDEVESVEFNGVRLFRLIRKKAF